MALQDWLTAIDGFPCKQCGAKLYVMPGEAARLGIDPYSRNPLSALPICPICIMMSLGERETRHPCLTLKQFLRAPSGKCKDARCKAISSLSPQSRCRRQGGRLELRLDWARIKRELGDAWQPEWEAYSHYFAEVFPFDGVDSRADALMRRVKADNQDLREAIRTAKKAYKEQRKETGDKRSFFTPPFVETSDDNPWLIVAQNMDGPPNVSPADVETASGLPPPPSSPIVATAAHSGGGLLPAVPEGAAPSTPPSCSPGRRPRDDGATAAAAAPAPPPTSRSRREYQVSRQQPEQEDESTDEELAARMTSLVLQRRERGEFFWANPDRVYWKRLSVSIEFIEFDRGTVGDFIFENSDDRTQPQNSLVRIQIGNVSELTFATATPAPPSSRPRKTVTKSLDLSKVFRNVDPFPEGQTEVPATVSLGCNPNGVGGVVEPNCLVFYKDPTPEDKTANMAHMLLQAHNQSQAPGGGGGGGGQSDSYPDGSDNNDGGAASSGSDYNGGTASFGSNCSAGAASSSPRRHSFAERALAWAIRALCGQLVAHGRRDLIQQLERIAAKTNFSLVQHEVFLALWARSVAEVTVSFKRAGAPPNFSERVHAFLGYDADAKLADDYAAGRVLTTAAKKALSRRRRQRQDEDYVTRRREVLVVDDDDDDEKNAEVAPAGGGATPEAMPNQVDSMGGGQEVVEEPESKQRLDDDDDDDDYHAAADDDDDDDGGESVELTHEELWPSSGMTAVPGYDSEGAGPLSAPTLAQCSGETLRDAFHAPYARTHRYSWRREPDSYGDLSFEETSGWPRGATSSLTTTTTTTASAAGGKKKERKTNMKGNDKLSDKAREKLLDRIDRAARIKADEDSPYQFMVNSLGWDSEEFWPSPEYAAKTTGSPRVIIELVDLCHDKVEKVTCLRSHCKHSAETTNDIQNVVKQVISDLSFVINTDGVHEFDLPSEYLSPLKLYHHSVVEIEAVFDACIESVVKCDGDRGGSRKYEQLCYRLRCAEQWANRATTELMVATSRATYRVHDHLGKLKSGIVSGTTDDEIASEIATTTKEAQFLVRQAEWTIEPTLPERQPPKPAVPFVSHESTLPERQPPKPAAPVVSHEPTLPERQAPNPAVPVVSHEPTLPERQAANPAVPVVSHDDEDKKGDGYERVGHVDDQVSDGEEDEDGFSAPPVCRGKRAESFESVESVSSFKPDETPVKRIIDVIKEDREKERRFDVAFEMLKMAVTLEQHLASLRGEAVVVGRSVARGIEPSEAASYGYGANFKLKPIHVAAMSGHVEAVEEWIKTGVDANVVSDRERTPLQHAAANGQLEVVKLLVEKYRVPLDDVDTQRNTALIRAAHKGHIEIVKFLVEKGANPLHRNFFCRTARQEALRKSRSRVVAYLKDVERRKSLPKSTTKLLPEFFDLLSSIEECDAHDSPNRVHL